MYFKIKKWSSQMNFLILALSFLATILSFASSCWILGEVWLLCCLVTKSCPILCDPMDCSPPGFPFHGISQARALERTAVSFSRGSSRLRDWTRIFRIGRCIPYPCAPREASEKRGLLMVNSYWFPSVWFINCSF